MNFFQKIKSLFRSKSPLKHRTPSSINADDPLSREEFQRIFNSKSTASVPPHIAESLAIRKITFSTSDRVIDATRLIKSGEIPNTWSFSFPVDAKIGLSVKNIHKLDFNEVAKKFQGVEASNAFLPDWSKSLRVSPLNLKPRVDNLSSFDGGVVTPTVGIYGADDREELYPDSYPLYLVGRVDVYINGKWAWYGSGALVGPRHIVTAGHVVPWAADDWGILFTPGYYDGESVLGAGASSWATDATGWNTNDHPAAHDIAVLRLEIDLGNWLGHFGARTFKSKWLYNPYFSLIGYPGDLNNGERPYVQDAVPFVGIDSDKQALEIQHHADMFEGQSGGPLCAQWSDGPYIVGTQSGGKAWHGSFLGIFDYDYNLAAGGNSLVNLVNWARATWP